MASLQLNGRWVLVTGASGGLGLEMARQLARDHGAHLVLTARRADRLAALKEELESAYGVRCHIVAADLAVAADVERVYAESLAQGEVEAVVLNAGVTNFQRHLDIPWENFQSMLATNVTSLVRLATLFGHAMAARRHGAIMLVGSIAGFLPVPYQAAYAATKAFVNQFGQGLYHELRGAGVSVTVFSPGGIATDMTNVGGLSYFKDSIFIQSVESSARDGVNALVKRRYLVIPGILNRIQVFAARLAPRKLLSAIAAVTYKRALDAYLREAPAARV